MPEHNVDPGDRDPEKIVLIVAVCAVVVVLTAVATLASFAVALEWRNFWPEAGQPFATVLGGLAVLGGGTLALLNGRRQRVADREVADDEARRETAKELNARFITATNQFADTKPTIRLAGAYALAALADDWTVHGNAGEQQVCVDVLCSYLRSCDSEDIQLGRENQSDTELRKTVQRIIAEHLQTEHPTDWTTSNFDFSGATLTDLEMESVTFKGSVNFDRCVFDGERTIFNQATFAGQTTSFANATFKCKISTEFFDASFMSLGGTTFDGSTFNCEWTMFSRSRFNGFAHFNNVVFSSLNTQFSAAQFCAVAAFTRTKFDTFVNFQQTKFAGWQTVFSWAEFNRAAQFDQATIEIPPVRPENISPSAPPGFMVDWWADTQPESVTPKPWPPDLPDKPAEYK